MSKSLVINVFDFERYDLYLNAILASETYGHGSRKRLGDFIGVQNSFISLVLTQKAHLTPEQTVKVSQFLKLNADESEYLLLMVQGERTGSVDLKKHYQQMKERILKKRSKIKSRIQANQVVTTEDQLTYYSHAYYSMIHILCSVPGYNEMDAICKTLKIEKNEARKYLDFLLQRGFIEAHEGGYRIGKLRIHLASGSPMLTQHHTNYRMQTVQRLETVAPKDLHYSGI